MGMILLAALLGTANQETAAHNYIVQSGVTTTLIHQTCATHSGDTFDGCVGYVLGVFDALSLRDSICPSYGTTTDQIIAVVEKYLGDHPEEWSKASSFVLQEALVGAFPCPKSR